METPPPNDSLKAPLSPPVGGGLCSFRRVWQTNKCSNNVLNIITDGYALPFITKPNSLGAVFTNIPYLSPILVIKFMTFVLVKIGPNLVFTKHVLARTIFLILS